MNEAQFRARMNKVAEANDDRFKTTFTIEDGTTHIEVIETADQHVFLSAHGDDVEHAIEHALKKLPDALDAWSYEDSE